MKRITSIILLACVTITAIADRADYRIIPLPKTIETDTTKVFTLHDGMSVAYEANDPEVVRNAQFLCQWIEELTGLKLVLSPDDKAAPVRLVLGFSADKKLNKSKKSDKPDKLTPQQEEAYTITVDNGGIVLTARKPIGFFRAAQTLRKSLPIKRNLSTDATSAISVDFPFTKIADEPRFEYRDTHLDCSRHFFSVDFIKRYLDVLALHGCNQFHWHLTDNDGWRFEVKALPELAEKGQWREQSPLRRAGLWDGVHYGGRYTQE